MPSTSAPRPPSSLHHSKQQAAPAAGAPEGSQPSPQSAAPATQPAGTSGSRIRRRPTPHPRGAAASFLFDPPTVQAVKGNTFAVNLLISGAQNVYSVPVQLNYDPKMLQLVNVSNGGFLSQDGQVVALVHREDEALGQSQITATRPPGAGGVSGQGAVVTITFMAKTDGQTPLTITRGGARDPGLQADHGQRRAGGGNRPMMRRSAPVVARHRALAECKRKPASQ